MVAYSLDGHVADPPDEAAARVAVRAFLRAHAGLDNARAALDFALAREPDLDPDRIFAVGHSSVATLALRVGAEDPRIKATVAFAPVADVARGTAEARDFVASVDPEGPALLRASSPIAFVAALRARPVFLFSAEDDSNVPTADVRALFEAMAPAHPASTLVTVATGDHYASMIAAIPAAADWLAAR